LFCVLIHTGAGVLPDRAAWPSPDLHLLQSLFFGDFFSAELCFGFSSDSVSSSHTRHAGQFPTLVRDPVCALLFESPPGAFSRAQFAKTGLDLDFFSSSWWRCCVPRLSYREVARTRFGFWSKASAACFVSASVLVCGSWPPC
jgi:hypothetical protein